MGKKKCRKKNAKSRKLFHKYFTIITSVILLSVIIVCLTYMFLATRYWNTEQINTMQHNSEIIADNAQDILARYNRKNAESSTDTNSADSTDTTPLVMICNTLRSMSNAVNADIFITNMDGKVVVCKEMMDEKFNFTNNFECVIHKNYNISTEIIEKASDEDYSEVDTLGGTFVNNQITAASPIKVNGKTVAIVFATEPITSSWYSYATKIIQIFLIATLMALIVSFITVYYLSYRLTKPLRQMSIATQHYAEGDFSYKVEVRGNDELAELAGAFNTMAMSLSTLESSRRSFVANVSHELKTPMTSIGGFIDGMLDGTIKEDKYDYYLKLVSDEVKRLSRLVTGMLNMSKLEAGEMHMNLKHFDLSSDIIKTVLTFEKKINDKSIEIIGLDTMESLTVNADEDMLMQVVYNLIDNAVKFTPKNGYILFKAYTDNEKTFVCIRNSGAGIEREEIGKVFERFYKIDKSRSYDVKGAGLGLYLVKSIIELHGGQIKADSKVGEYTEFVFWIPNV
jgi:signal transduction histidine kinase